ncbi:MAG: leucine-rich repeat domain-containing protein [Treponemataceae bacterium]|nr:leucine-rich repeat domain-containing protein [Treponemataceae bacterium]
MKENISKFLSCFALFLILAVCVSCGGGGGGSASLFMPENELRNGGTGGWGGKGKKSSFGAPASNLVLTGGTSLDVDYYVYNGQRYNTAEELLAVLTAQVTADGTYSVDVYVSGENSARPGRYVVSGDRRTLQHPYKINIALPEGGSLYPPATSGTATEYFYASEGFPVSKLGSDPVTENCGVSTSVDFPLAGWNIGGQTVASNGKITGFSGDMNLIAAKVPEKYTVDNDVLAFSSACQNGESFTIPSSVSFSTIVISSRLDNEPIKLNLADSGYHNDTYTNEFKNVMDQNSVNRISSIILPNNITKINSGGAFGAFESSTTLTSVTIPASVEIIDDSSFYDCSSLTTVTFSGNSNLRTIAEDAFNGCSNLAQITIPSGVTTIGDNAFSDCSSLVQITIPKTVATTGEGVFINCTSLRTVTFESDSELEYINDGMFLLCSQLQAIDIPSGVESIGTNAFSGCSALQTVTIPDGVITIDQNAFLNCSNLRNVEIPSSVSMIGQNAFKGINFDSNNEIMFWLYPNDITYGGSDSFDNGSMATWFDGSPGGFPGSVVWNSSNSNWD